MKETLQKRKYLNRLRSILAERFGDQDLRTLCSNLGIDYDDLPAQGKANKARELIDHLDRRKRLPELTEIGKKVRPDVDWEGTPEMVRNTQPEQGPIRIKVDIVIKVLVPIVVVVLIWVVYRQTALKTSGFDYLVQVQDSITGEYVQDAEVTIQVPEKVPLDDKTDVKGIAAIAIDSSYAGQRGNLIVEASGYRRYEQKINLAQGVLPDVVQLEQVVGGLTPTPTPTRTPMPTPTFTPTPTPTPTPTFTPTPTPMPEAEVSSDSLNLRAGCGTGYRSLANYPQRTALNVLGKAAGAEWLRVETPDGRTGWMYARYLQVNVPLVDVPIAACTFQDFERDNGTPPGGGNYFWDAWFTTCSFESTIVHEGGRSVCVDAHARTEGSPTDTGGTMGINPSSSDPVDLSSATTIYVWVYDTQGSNTVELKLRDIEESVSNPVWSTMQSVQSNWTKIEWALSGFTGVDKRHIKNLEIYEWNDGIYYFDNVGWQ